MERLIIDIKQQEYEKDCNAIIDTVALIEKLKPVFKENEVPYTLENIKDLLQGGKEIEKFLYERLEKDIENIKTPELRKSQKNIAEESIWQFLNHIRDAIKPKNGFSNTVVPAKVLKHFEMFILQNEKLCLYKGWKEVIKEKYIVYATPEQETFIAACNELLEGLNKIRKLWTLSSDMPLDIIFKNSGGRFKVNTSYEKDYIATKLSKLSMIRQK
jgi:malate synthase